jgi:predicted nucleic acid-binding protein
MRAYADSSFLLRLVTGEPGTEPAVAEYRRLDRPGLFYLPLHAMEVENAIRQRAFHERRVRPSGERFQVGREREAALARLGLYCERHALIEVAVDMDSAIERARELSAKHTDRLGARAIDLLHVACALLLESEIFLTFDARQLELASAEGLRTPVL